MSAYRFPPATVPAQKPEAVEIWRFAMVLGVLPVLLVVAAWEGMTQAWSVYWRDFGEAWRDRKAGP